MKRFIFCIIGLTTVHCGFAQNSSDITGGAGEIPVRNSDENLEEWLRRNRKDVAPVLTSRFLGPVRSFDDQRGTLDDLVRGIGVLFAGTENRRKGPGKSPQDSYNAWTRAVRDFESASKWVVVYGRQAVPTEGQVSPAFLARSVRATQDLIAASYALAERTLDLLEYEEYRASEVARERFGQVVVLLRAAVENLKTLYEAQVALSVELSPKAQRSKKKQSSD